MQVLRVVLLSFTFMRHGWRRLLYILVSVIEFPRCTLLIAPVGKKPTVEFTVARVAGCWVSLRELVSCVTRAAASICCVKVVLEPLV